MFDTLYYNSVFIVFSSKTLALPAKIGFFFLFLSCLVFTIHGVYAIVTSNKFFPPIYFTIDNILTDNQYGFSGLIKILVGVAFIFYKLFFVGFFIILLLFLMWWIYKKLMLK